MQPAALNVFFHMLVKAQDGVGLAHFSGLLILQDSLKQKKS